MLGSAIDEIARFECDAALVRMWVQACERDGSDGLNNSWERKPRTDHREAAEERRQP